MTHYISRNEKILGGQPVITGTRIPAMRIKHLIDSGYTEDNLKKEFPGVSVKKIRGSISELVALGLESV